MRRFAVVVIALLWIGVGPAFARVPVKMMHTTRTRAHGSYVQSVVSPEVHGIRQAARINALLRKTWPVNPDNLGEPGQVYREDVRGTVELNRGDILSVYYEGLGVITQGGRIATAHPTKLASAVTLNVRTSHAYTFAELFREPGGVARLVHGRIERQLGAGCDPDPAATTWAFYLTDRAMVVIFPDAPFAVASVKVKIPWSDLRPFANPHGPLPVLMRAR